MDGSKCKTVRHAACKFVSANDSQCKVCKQYRCDLFAKRHRMRKKEKASTSSLSSHARNDLMTEESKAKKLKLLKEKCQQLESENARLRKQIETIFINEGVILEEDEGSLLRKIMQGGEKDITALMEKESPQYLLWQQQKENLKKSPNRWRWHPEIIKWSVAIHAKSPAAYNLLRRSGLLTLPSLVTINKFIHFSKSNVGMNPEILQRVVQDINATAGVAKENVTLILDEMKIKSGIVFSVSSGKLVGFTDTGSVNNMMNDFERRVAGDEDPKKLPMATHVLVFMIRTIFAGIKAPVAYFATQDLKGDDMYPIIWECIRHLELFDINVRAIVCDGASPNRKLFKIHGKDSPDAGLTYYTENPFRNGERIYFICDVPHLLKTTRNNWENSGCNSKSRNLKFRGKEVRWSHLIALQEWDQQLNAPSPGLRFVHKLTYEHINLNPALRMRVYLAAQVLSNTVANAIESMGHPEKSSTVLFIRKMNYWFDCLNVANTTQHIHSRNPAIAPYRSVDDERLKWLEEDFLPFLDEWNAEALNASDVPKKERYKLFLSRETYTGHQITVKSFVSLTKELLAIPSVKYILSEKFSQDPLEEYFSKQRGCGGRNENPTVEQVGHNMLSLIVAGSKAMSSMRSNCRKRPTEEEELEPKRKQQPN